MTYTAKVIADRNKARIEAINNPDNVLKMFQKERNWLLPEDFEEVIDMAESREEVKEAVNKAVNPFLKGMVFGMFVSLAVFVVTFLVVAL